MIKQYQRYLEIGQRMNNKMVKTFKEWKKMQKDTEKEWKIYQKTNKLK